MWNVFWELCNCNLTWLSIKKVWENVTLNALEIQKVFSALICRYFWKDLPPLIRTNIIAPCLNHIYRPTTTLTAFSKFHVPTVLRWALYNLKFQKICYLYDNQCIYINNTCPVEMFVNVSLNFCLMCVSFLFYLYLILHWIKCLCKLTQCNLDTAIIFSLLSVFTFSLVYSNAHSCTKWQKSIFLFFLLNMHVVLITKCMTSLAGKRTRIM